MEHVAAPTRPLAPSAQRLDANLLALGERNAAFAQALRRTPPASDIEFFAAEDGAVSATWRGRALASRRRPLDEADRLADSVDLAEHAVVVALGFGLGHHVATLARRTKSSGLIIVFDPDLALLRAVFEHIDHAAWLRDALILFVHDPDDRGALNGQLQGAEAILAQGVAFLTHPPSRARLGEQAVRFSDAFAELISGAKTTLLTTLVRSADTIRNLLHNVDHYVGGEGVAPFRNIWTGRPAVLVAAGPSLHRNIDQLADPRVRERCAIIAVQTTLKPLLERGVRPHFVTSLDYHAISARFFEGLAAADVEGVTLIAEAKANPAVLDAFPGPVRCIASPFLDGVLGPLARDMGALPAGATVAHLSVYLARWLGCDPLILIGQDLGFTDGLYYAPRTAIHDVWSAELHALNTIEMMEWRRIVRHRTHLVAADGVDGRSVFTDRQMTTYRQQFERDFSAYAAEGVSIINATEGGVAIQHTTPMTLAEALDRHLGDPLPAPPSTRLEPDADRITAARRRLGQVRRDVDELTRNSRDARAIVEQMINAQDDPKRMDRLFNRLETCIRRNEENREAFAVVEQMNQLGAFKRLKADRKIHLAESDPVARQRAQLERDRENLDWIRDAGGEMSTLLQEAGRLLDGETIGDSSESTTSVVTGTARKVRTGALVPVDPEVGGLGQPRRLDAMVDGRTVLQATLERLARTPSLHEIVLLTPDGFDPAPLINEARLGADIVVEPVGPRVFPPSQSAVAAARRAAPSAWRNAVAGFSVYDEALSPAIMSDVMQARRLDAALLVGPDWPLVQPDGPFGCEAVIRRHAAHPDQHRLVFTQAPPGLCAGLVSAGLMQELVRGNRLSGVGPLLTYQPHAPQHDPIARDANVQIDPLLRQTAFRAVFDTPRSIDLIRRIAEGRLDDPDFDSRAALHALIECDAATPHDQPTTLLLELTSERDATGRFAELFPAPSSRGPMSVDDALALLDQFDDPARTTLMLAGCGDPLRAPSFDAVARAATKRGMTLHVRTELSRPEDAERLLAAGADVISIDLQADRAETFVRMHGRDELGRRIDHLQRLHAGRRRLSEHEGAEAFALPWLAPRITRLPETLDDLDPFFDRWQHLFGCAVIDGPPPTDEIRDPRRARLAPAVTPPAVFARHARTRLAVFADGRVPFGEMDLAAHESAGTIPHHGLAEVWARVCARRTAAHAAHGDDAPLFRTPWP